MPTLAQHKRRPFTTCMDLSGVFVNTFVEQVRNAKPGLGKVSPEQEAIHFYLSNHVVSLIASSHEPDEPLPPEVNGLVESYYASQYKSAVRLVYYLYLICVRESRHCQDKDKAIKEHVSKVGDEGALHAFMETMPCGSDSAARHGVTYFFPEDCTIGELVHQLEVLLFKGKYSSAFGGEKWGGIAKVLRQFLHGEISAEMLVDTAFTLQHNTSAIFNKGMLYHAQNDHALIRILDAQRAGQIPEYVKSKDYGVSAIHTSLLEKAEKLFGAFNSSVDWAAVKGAGGIGEHEDHTPVSDEKSDKVAHWKMKLKQKKEAKKKAEFLNNSVLVLPGVYLPKVKRSEQEAS